MARKSADADVLDSGAVVSTSSNFDFLEGSFRSAQRNRRVGIGVVLAAAVVLVMLMSVGLNALVSGRTLTAELSSTHSQIGQENSTLAKIDTAGGISADQISAHVAQRRTSLIGAVANEIDVVNLVRQLQQSAPAGVTVTAITFTSPSSSSTSNTSGSASSSTGSSTASGTGVAVPASTLGSVEIDGVGSSYALINVWKNQVQKLSGVGAVNVSWNGGPPSLTIKLIAPITTQGLTARSQTARKAGN